jgi:hypothetical protein
MKAFFLIFAIVAASLARTYYDDTAIIRSILDLNAQYSIAADSFSDSSNGRVTSLTLFVFDTIPATILELDSLKHLSIFQNRGSLLNVPKVGIAKEFWNQPYLDELEFSSAKIDIPPEIQQLTNLRKLGFEETWVYTVPPEFWTLANLEYLDISSVPLGSYPAPLANFTKLKTLRFRYAAVPPVFTLPESLEEIFLQQSGFVPLPPQLFSCVNAKTLAIQVYETDTLSRPYPDGLGIDSLPTRIANLKNLSFLNLEYANVKYLPSEISQLTKLQYLNLDFNSLKELPASIVSLNGICLALDGNYLCDVPVNVQQWIDTCLCTTGWRSTQVCADPVKSVKSAAKGQEFAMQTDLTKGTVTFRLPESAKEMEIYDIFGRLVYRALLPGSILSWRWANMSGGFVCKVKTETRVYYKHFMLLK